MRPGEFTDAYLTAQRGLAKMFADAGGPPGSALRAEQDAAARLPPVDP
ncbi:MAG: hypothetical protein ACT4RN_12540 [Pseudonocardia sp.]